MSADLPENAAAPAARPPVDVDDKNILPCYANFCRVSSTPEELILDLGLNPQPLNADPGLIKINQRIVMNHFTAKRLIGALSMAIQRHEQVFGILETDLRKRVK